MKIARRIRSAGRGGLLLLGLLACVARAPAVSPEAVERIHRQTCGLCHDGQVPSAPRKGDTAAWAPRLREGPDVMLERVIEGYSVMPPKGMCFTCSDEELRAVIEWLSH